MDTLNRPWPNKRKSIVSDQLNAIVSQRIEVASGLIVLRVKPDGWELPQWKSGQFGILGLPVSAQRIRLSDPEEADLKPDKLIKRAYSISSSSQEKDYLEFFITLVHRYTYSSPFGSV